MRVALLQFAAIQKSRAANLQSLMAAIDRAASSNDELDLLVLPAIDGTHGTKAGQRGLFASVSETIGWKAREWGVYIAASLCVQETKTIRPCSFLFDPDGDVVARTKDVSTGESAADQESSSWCSSPVGRIGVVDMRTAEAVIFSPGDRREVGFVAFPLPSPTTAAERRLLDSTLRSLRRGADATPGVFWGVAGRVDDGVSGGKAVTFFRDASGIKNKDASLAGETELHVEIDFPAVCGDAGIVSRSSDDQTG